MVKKKYFWKKLYRKLILHPLIIHFSKKLCRHEMEEKKKANQ